MKPIVEIHNLTHRYGRTIALDHLTLEIPQGAIYGFIGPNGAGKTTTMRILTTLLQPSSGEAFVATHSVTRERYAVRQNIGFMPDFFGVYDSMRSWEYLEFFAAAYNIPVQQRTKLIDDLLDLVSLSHKRDEFVMGLSRGMKQRLSLARTMVHNPPLLILDEPASGLDPRARIELRELLKELRTMHKTIMISSHILTELAEMCTHIGIIDKGTLLASGDVATILQSLQPHRVLEARLIELHESFVASVRDMPGVLRVYHTDIATTPATTTPDEQSVNTQSPTLYIDYQGDDAGVSEILTHLVSVGARITHFASQISDLEDIFLKVTDMQQPQHA